MPLTSFLSLGEIFPLQGTLCQKLEEELARFCFGTADRAARPAAAATAAAASAGRDLSDRDSDGSTNIHVESSREGGCAGAAEGAAAAAAGGAATERDSSAIRFAIETIRESTGVSADLAAYALLVSKVRHKQFYFVG